MINTASHLHVRQTVLDLIYPALLKAQLPINDVVIESFDTVDPENLPLIIIRPEDEQVIGRSLYMAGNNTVGTNSLDVGEIYENDENGKLIVRSEGKETDLCFDKYTNQQTYTIEILVQHKTGVTLLVDEIVVKIQKAIAALAIARFYFDGSFVTRPDTDKGFVNYSRTLRYLHQYEAEAAHTNILRG